MDLNALHEELAECAKVTGAFIASERKNISLNDAKFKGLNDMVTEVDLESEKRITNFLKKLLPGADIIGEEGKYENTGSKYKWIIDPLDGTTNYIHGIPAYAISIALCENDEPILGVVHDPERVECFTAIKGKGAFLNNEKIGVSKSGSLDKCLMATGFPVTIFDKTTLLLKITESFIRETHGVRRIGSAALDLAYVACGRFEGFFEYNLNAWDVAAGALLVQEAGGIVSDFQGGDQFLFGKQILAGNSCHSEMLTLIKKHW